VTFGCIASIPGITRHNSLTVKADRMSLVGEQIHSLPNVSVLSYGDEAMFRVSFPKDAVHYSRSWLYVLRASHLEGGELGYKFVTPDAVAVIGVRNGFVYVTPVADATQGIRLRQLCESISELTGSCIILKKTASLISSASCIEHRT
jgi:hypothetical protein